MILSRLVICNFMPYKGRHEIAFSEDSNRNVTLVFGDNMRGKTSLMNALRWAFYERAVDRYGEEIPLHLLLNTDAGDESDWKIEVGIRFSHEGKLFDLQRKATRRTGVGSPRRPEDYLVESFLRVDGAALTADQIHHAINQIVPEQISRFFLFDGELLQEYEALINDDGDQGKRIKGAIEQVLGVPALTQGVDDLKVVLQPFVKANLSELQQDSKAKQFAVWLQKLERDASLLENDKSEFLATQNSAKHTYTALQQRIAESESRFAQFKELEKQLERKVMIGAELRSIRAQRLDLIRDAWLDLLRPLFEKRLSDVQGQLTAELDELREELIGAMRRDSGLSGICKLCESPLDEDKVARLKGVSSSQASISVSSYGGKALELASLSKAISGIRYPQVKRQLLAIDMQELKLTAEETQIVSKVAQLETELAGFDSDDIRKVRRDAENALAAVRLSDSKIEDIGRQIEKNLEEQEKARTMIGLSQKGRATKNSRAVQLIEDLRRCFTSAVVRLRDDLRADIERKATSAFKTLTTDSSYKGLQINSNYGLLIIDRNDRAVSLRSAGAEQIVALSLIDALNQTGRSAGPVVMDTPFGRLDPKHRSRVLAHLPDSATQVILFVHEGEIRKDRDLDYIASRVGVRYVLNRVSSSQTEIVKDGP